MATPMRTKTMAETVAEGEKIVRDAEARAAPPAKVSRTTTMAETVAEGKKIVEAADARASAAAAAPAAPAPKPVGRTKTMAETVDEARRLLKVDALWKLVDPKDKDPAEKTAAAGDTDEETPKKKQKNGKKKATPKKKKGAARKSVKGGDAAAAAARVEADRVAAEHEDRAARAAAARGADRSAAGVAAAWGNGEHHLSVLYLSQERTADIAARGTDTLGAFFSKLSAEFGVDVKELRLVVHSPVDGSYRQLDGADAVFQGKTLIEISILPADTLHLMRNMFVIAEGATAATGRALDRVICDVTWDYPPGVWRDYLDATCMAFSRDGRRMGHVDWRDRSWEFLSHSGNMMNDAARQGHDRIEVNFARVPAEVETLFFLASSWTAEHVSVFPNPAVSIVDAHNEELCPPHVKEFGSKFRALVLMAITRSATVEGAWDVVALGKGSDGNTRMYDMIEKTLRETCLPIVTAAH